jgi:hypothetical protein
MNPIGYPPVIAPVDVAGKAVSGVWALWFSSLYAKLTTPATLTPIQAATVNAPAYAKGAIYFDLTLNKLRVGGATAWETVTSV